ncbi:potassium efflux system protein [Marinospirillum celere]|uniref:Potassium efflux system protein n=1 Tax=Marinospirillum celere TaxID=1122252 RepID=A0A1I1I202_9GAMM|nr:mechanosensitive ion channel domain-containing protein [Marinospirillum celere]SFC30234.1 potassium efflux system protein [Marinospirillum celere]
MPATPLQSLLKGLLICALLLVLPVKASGPVQSAEADLQQQLADLRRQQQQLEAQSTELEEQLEALGNSPLVYQVLQQQRANLPRLDAQPDLSEALAELRLREFALSQQLRLTRAQDEDISHLLLQQQHLQQQRKLLISLQQEQIELLETTQHLKQDIDERLFWIPSNPPMTLGWWQQLPGNFVQLGKNLDDYLAQPEEFSPRWSLFLLLAIPALALLIWRKKIRAYLDQLNDQASAVAEVPVSPWLTSQALALNFGQLLPLPLALLALAQLLQPPSESSFALADALVALALSGLVVSLVHQLIKPSGLAEQLLNWSPDTLAHLRSFIAPLGWLLIPASFILAILEKQYLMLPEDPLGPLILIALGLLLAEQFGRLMWRLPPLYSSPLLHWLITLPLVTLPLTLATITSLGYYYSGLQLTTQLLATLYLLVAWVITEATLYKIIHQTTARLAHERELEEEQLRLVTEQAGSGEEMALTTSPLPRLEVDQIHQQSLRLARFLLLIGFGSLFYWVWSDLFTVFSYLDTLNLPFSINDLLLAAFILVFTLFLAGNLPGLLEILVLSRLQLQQGSAYAITSLLNYAITATGLVLVLATLGVSWDKLQWLIAALSVGLGFGLQEIFANFISGLILLFERPVRIGDVVTLGNLSGRVRQIRIRATIITDFDRRDIIVPNKNFITGQLVNWSLADTVTRIIVKVGVAYGSDLDKTREILLEAAQVNERALTDPAPQVLFLEFGDSTLNHELRLHVKELSDRNPAIDEINRFIDRRFKEEGIEVAFRQLDIHLRNSEGVEKLVAVKTPN